MQKLPKQSESQIKGRNAIKTLLNLFPESWIVREPNPDYGVDLEVEVWYEYPTNRISNLQVKYVSDPFSMGYQIKKSTLNYLYSKPNSYIVFVNNGDIEVSSVKQIIEIFYTLNQNNAETITIPVIFNFDRNNFVLSTRNNFYRNPAEVIQSAVSGEFFRRERKNYEQTQKTIPYFSLFNSENEFWKYEYYIKLGDYYQNKNNSKSIVSKLKGIFDNETQIGKAGILMCINTLNLCDSWSRQQSEILITKNNPIILISCLNTLSEPDKSTNYEFLIGYLHKYERWYVKNLENIEYKNYEDYFTSFQKDVFQSIEIAIINSISRMHDENSINYLLNSCLPLDPYSTTHYFSLNLLKNKISESTKYSEKVYKIQISRDINFNNSMDIIMYLRAKAKEKIEHLLKTY